MATQYHYGVLDNGLRLGFALRPESDVVSLVFAIHAGSANDPIGKEGTAHFLEHMLFKGKKARPLRAALEREIERYGGSVDAFTVKEFTWLVVKTPKAGLERSLHFMQESFLNPVFSEEELIGERNVILEELRQYEESAYNVTEDLFEKCLYENNRVSRKMIGSETTLKRIHADDIADFFDRHYGARNYVITVAGGASYDEVRALVQRYLGHFPVGRRRSDFVIAESQSRAHFRSLYRASGQVRIAFGFRSYPLCHPDHYALKLIAVLLGGNTSARLFLRLREELGLVYDLSTLSESRGTTGYIVTHTGVDREKIRQVLATLIEEHERLIAERVHESDLDDAKNFLVNKRFISSEDSSYLAFDLAKGMLMDKKAKELSQYRERVFAVTSDDILRVARELFVTGHLNVAMVGPMTAIDRLRCRAMLRIRNDS
jgi:predicted Zn-dependent peptidase